ncbi:carbohydrate ABC transporter membrane protein 1 (CUT1 family) [Kribbella voronezhensis]|uniref:Carbohydrate ABC transporter membrane protein 1 (CUT1 family) n=1 Tax=Kribbella voronezhensis TaxID=2512212 RepID=A0A4R7TBL9_9ACTN|nr:sugar ABC transporter permease [Kribbella voronezhensis]TDU88677.1 carbohydrate ABC transporter membrane protein 1 (CUT1 family) [Kribbella voronezhensis]
MTPEVVPDGGPQRSAVRRRRPLTFDRISFMVVFLGLPLAVFVIFVVSPFVQALWYSLTDWSGFSSKMNFVGFDNYVRLFHDDIFLKAVRNNVELAVVVPIVTIVLALTLATLVTIGGSGTGTVRGLRNSGFYRIVSFFPYVIPAIVIGLIWAQVFTPSTGILDALLSKVGLKGFADYAWLGDARTAMPASMFVMIWGFVGFYMVLFIAAIRGIDPEVFEAARIDGAGRFRTAVSLTLPLIRDNVQTAYVYLGIAALDAFVYMQALNPGGGPQNSTLVMPQQLFTTAFAKGQFGYSTAMGVILAAVTMLFALLVFSVNWLTGGRDRKVRR